MLRFRLLPLAAALLAATSALAQLPAHEAYEPGRRVSQTVRLLDAWEDGTSRGARPKDVLTQVRTVTGDADVTRIDLVLYGDWGAHLQSFEDEARRRDATSLRSARTAWRALDIDADGRQELVFIQRELDAARVLDENGEPAAGDPIVLHGYAVSITCLDRVDGALVEREVPADPASPAMAVILAQEFGGATNAILQQAAGDFLFAKQDFAGAKYRYQAAAEWAERSLSGAAVSRLAPGMPISEPDPDDPVVVWLATQWRRSALPPYWQRW